MWPIHPIQQGLQDRDVSRTKGAAQSGLDGRDEPRKRGRRKLAQVEDDFEVDTFEHAPKADQDE